MCKGIQYLLTFEIVDGSISCDKAIAPFTSSAAPVVMDDVFAPMSAVVVISPVIVTVDPDNGPENVEDNVPVTVVVDPDVVNVTPLEPVDSFNCAPEDTISTIASGVVTPKPVLPPVKIPAF